MTGAGEALMGIGEARGPDRALRAAQLAVKNPLLEDITIDGAKGVITNIVGSRDITLHEVGEAMNYIYSACPEAHVFYGHAFDETLEDRIQITVIATGFPAIRTTVGLSGRKAAQSRLASRPVSERRVGARTGTLPAAGESMVEDSEIGAVNKKTIEEELQKPAFLRLRPNRLHP
jgi:cell division protein FtsZ